MQQIPAVFSICDWLRLCAQLVNPNVAKPERNFFQASDLQPLAQLDDLHKVGSLQQRVGGAGIEPGDAAPQSFHVKRPAFQISAIEIGDFQFASCRRSQAGSHLGRFAVVEVKTGYGVARRRVCRLFFQTGRTTRGIEADDSVSLRIADLIRKDRSASGSSACPVKERSEPAAMEIITENQT